MNSCLDDEAKNRAVGIALAVYNGNEFLSVQLESLQQQDYLNFKLYLRDDNSHDNSCELLKGFVKKDNRAHLLEDDKGNLGARSNFSYLLESNELSSFDYVALSDQDDAWMHDKLSVQMNLMIELEERYQHVPVLIHSDMTLVDSSLNELNRSFMNYMGIMHEDNALPVLLPQNFVTGCTVLVNRKLLEFALPFPDDALMHDWWLALCAAVFGYIGYIDKPLVKYRQHSNNEVGAKHVSEFFNPTSNKILQQWLEGRENLFQSMKQAQALVDRIQEHEPRNKHLKLVEEYASLQYLSPMQRLSRLQKLGVHAQSNVRQVLLLSRLLFASKVRNV